jgi:hypothetical protein
VLVVTEPPPQRLVPLAAWFRRRGARVALVPPERSADPRKHLRQAHQDRPPGLDLLALPPMLHPDGRHLQESLGLGQR